MQRFSASKLSDEFEVYSKLIPNLYGLKEATFDEEHRLVHPGPKIALADLKRLLLSKDIEQAQEELGKAHRRLTLNEPGEEHICFTGVPRAGNTWIRTLFENLTSNSTGSDMALNSFDLTNLAGGFYSENRAYDGTWLIKSHIPGHPSDNDFTFHKMLVMVRNPVH